MKDEANGDSLKKSEGEISDQHQQQSKDERKAMRTRTFTRWMNVFLQRSDPPVSVHNLFRDIQDGRILMALLEELSGCKLLYRFRSSPHHIFRLNNISKALAFLDDRHVKLLGIDASSIADGVPSVVLNLIWNIILYFQVRELTGGLQRHLSSSLSSLSMSSYSSSSDLSPQQNDIGSYSCSTLPSKGRKAAREPKYHGKAIRTLLQWIQRCTSKFGVEVHDFGKSWRSGLAFLAMIKSINPALVDLRKSLSRDPTENLQLAFMIAHHSLNIPPLLEPEDVSCSSPDEQSIITYVSMFLRHCSGIDENRTMDTEVLDIPNFGSLGSDSFGETFADDTEAQALLKSLGSSSEQRLWKQWARRSSGSLCASLLHTSGAVTSDLSFSNCRSQSMTELASTSPFNKTKSKSQSTVKPPSPLDTSVVSHEIRSWMEKTSVDESYVTLGSEEGLYSLSALDSDEEEAYSYILDLSKEDFQPYNQPNRQIPKVEEETTEEMFLNGQQTEASKHLELCEMLNGSGCKHQEGLLAQNVKLEVSGLNLKAQSGVNRESDWEKNGSSSTETANNGAAFDMEPGEGSRSSGEGDDDNVIRAQSDNDGNYCEEEQKKEETENTRLVTHGCDKTEDLIKETKKTKLFEVASRAKELEVKTERGLFEEYGQVSEKKVVDKEEEDPLMTSEGGQDRELGKEKKEEDSVKEEQTENEQSVAKGKVKTTPATTVNTDEEDDREVSAPKMEDLTCEYCDKVQDSMEFEAVISEEQKDTECKIKVCKQSAERAATTDHPDKTTPKNGTNGGVTIHSCDVSKTTCSANSHSVSREGGVILQSSASSCDITPLELQMLLVLWILLYCCFILP